MEEQRLISYGDTVKFEITEEEINGGTVVFEINTEELFEINDFPIKNSHCGYLTSCGTLHKSNILSENHHLNPSINSNCSL